MNKVTNELGENVTSIDAPGSAARFKVEYPSLYSTLVRFTAALEYIANSYDIETLEEARNIAKTHLQSQDAIVMWKKGYI